MPCEECPLQPNRFEVSCLWHFFGAVPGLVQDQATIRCASKNLFFFSKSFLHNVLAKCGARACRTHTARTGFPSLNEFCPKNVGISAVTKGIRCATLAVTSFAVCLNHAHFPTRGGIGATAS